MDYACDQFTGIIGLKAITLNLEKIYFPLSSLTCLTTSSRIGDVTFMISALPYLGINTHVTVFRRYQTVSGVNPYRSKNDQID